MKIPMSLSTLLLLLVITVSAAVAQTGGPYSITQSLIAGGGVGPSLGATYSLTGTLGQSIAGGNSTGAPYSVRSGFWTGTLAPTAATVGISGRVLDAAGDPLRNALITLTDGSGAVIVTRSNAFGYFSFDEVVSGQTYLVNLTARGRQFVPQVITVRDSLTGLEFRSLN